MPELVGTFGQFALLGGDRRVLDINLETSTAFFREIAIKKTDVVANAMKIYSFLPIGRYGKARMNKISVPRHLLQSRKNCLTWTPKGRVYMTPETIDTYPVEYMGEQCTDAFVGDCLEYVLGTGNDVRDIFATPEGRALFGEAINGLYLGLGNSFYDLVSYAGDSVITSSDTGQWWSNNVTTEEWNDFVDQQMGVTGLVGHIPLIEAAKSDGLSNFNVEIPSGDVSGDDYIGSDVTTLFESVKDAAPSKFKVALKRRQSVQAVMLVSQGIFDAYKQHIITTWNTIPEAYEMFIEGEVVKGVLMWDGIPVVCADEWTLFDETVGVNTHRVVLTALGNMAIAHDVVPLSQFNGMGMRIEQSTRLKDKGVVYMNTTFRVGTAIADTDFMVNASRILTP